MEKSVKLILILIIILLSILIISSFFYGETYAYRLHGTFLCEELPFDSMVFDDSDFTFYYYMNVDFLQKEDKGTFSRVTDSSSIYVIESEVFNNEVINFGKDDFDINISNKLYTFKKFSPLPIINGNETN